MAGSLGYQLSGHPLWSMDTGGYFHATDELNNTEYRELFVRWHQFASFTPVLRQHGRKGGSVTPGGPMGIFCVLKTNRSGYPGFVI